MKELLGVCEAAASGLSVLFILVDALDEASNKTRTALLDCLDHLLLKIESMKLICTARPHIQVEARFQPYEPCKQEIRGQDQDIINYTEDYIRNAPRLSAHVQRIPSLQGDILGGIQTKSGGM
jgi:hypothetical protein